MRYLRQALPILLLAVVTFASYWNALHDTLVFDDKMFAGQPAYSDLSRLPDFFEETVWAASGDAKSPLYRPLLLASFALDATLFPEQVALWHLVNVVLHVLATIMVYFLVLQLLRLSFPRAGSSVLVALLAAMVFGVHPIHTEVVNSIFNRSSLLVAIGTAAGLWWLLRYFQKRPLWAWTGIWLVYWPVLFSRETGVVLPALAVLLVWVYSSGDWRQRVRRCLPAISMALPLLVYLALRTAAIAPPAPVAAPGGVEQLGISDLVGAGVPFGWKYLLSVAGIWLDILRLAVWPQPMLIYHSPVGTLTSLAGLFVHLALLATAIYRYRRGHKGLIVGLGIFYVALLPTSLLHGSGTFLPFLCERFLYEPSIGLAVLLAFGLHELLRRGDRLLVVAPVLLVLCLLTPLTWARNADWSSDLALLEHEHRHGELHWRGLRAMIAELVLQGEPKRATDLCLENQKTMKRSGYLSLNCGTAYALAGDLPNAEQAFRAAAEDPASRPRAIGSLSWLLAAQGQRERAARVLERAIEDETEPATQAYFKALLLIRFYPNDRARVAEARAQLEEALRLQPGFALAASLLADLDRALQSAQ